MGMLIVKDVATQISVGLHHIGSRVEVVGVQPCISCLCSGFKVVDCNLILGGGSCSEGFGL